MQNKDSVYGNVIPTLYDKVMGNLCLRFLKSKSNENPSASSQCINTDRYDILKESKHQSHSHSEDGIEGNDTHDNYNLMHTCSSFQGGAEASQVTKYPNQTFTSPVRKFEEADFPDNQSHRGLFSNALSTVHPAHEGDSQSNVQSAEQMRWAKARNDEIDLVHLDEPKKTVMKKKKKKKNFLRKKTEKEREQEKRFQQELSSKDHTIAELREEMKRLEDKNDELLRRLSSLAGARLTDGNENIADLSDANRPTKLAEQFSELYDNEWTDAYACLEAGQSGTEEEICLLLLQTVCIIYSLCKEKAEKDLRDLVSNMQQFTGEDTVPKELLKQLKDTRKKKTKIALSKQVLKEKLNELFPDRCIRRQKAIKNYVNRSRVVCWFMAIQDPPVYMDPEINKKNYSFEGHIHRQYTKSGPLIAFVVWPSLYICKGGSLLSKGVVQCKSESTEQQEATFSSFTLDEEASETNDKNTTRTDIHDSTSLNDMPVEDTELNENVSAHQQEPEDTVTKRNTDNIEQNPTPKDNEHCPNHHDTNRITGKNEQETTVVRNSEHNPEILDETQQKKQANGEKELNSSTIYSRQNPNFVDKELELMMINGTDQNEKEKTNECLGEINIESTIRRETRSPDMQLTESGRRQELINMRACLSTPERNLELDSNRHHSSSVKRL